MRHVAGGINMDEHPDPGHKQEPDAGERVQQKSRIRLEIRLGSAVGDEIQVAGIGSEPGVEDLFKRLMIVSVGPTGVLHYRAAREQECEHDYPDADGIDRGFLHPPPEEEDDRRAERGQQRNQPNVVEENHVKF